MKKYILLFILLIAISVGLLMPYIEGYLVRDNYYQLVAWYQQKLQNNKDVQLRIESYELGWLQSTANMTIASSEKLGGGVFNMQPIVFRIKSIIHHGPLVKINGKW